MADHARSRFPQYPSEHVNLASAQPTRLAAMQTQLATLRKGYYSNDQKGVNSCPPGVKMECACWMAVHHWGGFFGPFQELPGNVTAPVSA